MVTWTRTDVIAHQTKSVGKHAPLAQPVERERGLHEAILDHCAAQWPRWKVIHARMDKRSTIQVGAQDLTIFMPGGNVLCIECKARREKLTPEQLAWATEMSMLGHSVHVVWSMEDFLAILKSSNPPPSSLLTGQTKNPAQASPDGVNSPKGL